MPTELSLILTPEQAYYEETYKEIFAKKANVDVSDLKYFQILNKSYDARSTKVKVNMRARLFINESYEEFQVPPLKLLDVSHSPEVVIVGAGPAGLFAAMSLIENGIKPIIIERGKRVGERKRDVAAISTKSIIDPNSNYAFGEGGAGTFSDGKLYTRSKKRGDIKRIYELFYLHGAQKDILYDSHPHIGSDVLASVIVNMRKSILEAGGQIMFQTLMTDIETKDGKMSSVVLSDGRKILTKHLILATGHSARDVYYMLNRHKILLESKGFAMGVRLEHPQGLIDQIQYHSSSDPYLPPAEYKLIKQVNDRGVYSFCMCPGGFIVPATTEQNLLVVNGMSPSKRNAEFANSGMVVEIKPEDIPDSDNNPLAGINYQRELEKIAFNNGGTGQVAPAQKMGDFVNNKLSAEMYQTSYFPGVVSSPMHFWLPDNIRERLQIAFKYFGNRMRGFLTNDAAIVGLESRTSSPVRIYRDSETLQSFPIEGLFPTGEGAGYAGGIVSSAVDGINVARKICSIIKS